MIENEEKIDKRIDRRLSPELKQKFTPLERKKVIDFFYENKVDPNCPKEVPQKMALIFGFLSELMKTDNYQESDNELLVSIAKSEDFSEVSNSILSFLEYCHGFLKKVYLGGYGINWLQHPDIKLRIDNKGKALFEDGIEALKDLYIKLKDLVSSEIHIKLQKGFSNAKEMKSLLSISNVLFELSNVILSIITVARQSSLSERQIIDYVIFDKKPNIYPLTIELKEGGYYAKNENHKYAIITLRDLSLDNKTIANEIRKKLSLLKKKTLTPKHLALLDLVDKKKPDKSWQELTKEWNKLYPKWQYKNRSCLCNAYNRLKSSREVITN